MAVLGSMPRCTGTSRRWALSHSPHCCYQPLSSPQRDLQDTAMSLASIAYDNNDPLGYGKVIFHHIPNELAPGFQACLIVYAICCGVMGLEIISNLDYDFALARRPGWLDWSKFPNRVAYFVSRYFSFIFLVNVLIFSTVGGLDCAIFGKMNQAMWLIPLCCVDFIFIKRTLALYAWNRKLSFLLYTYYVADVAFAVAALMWFGVGYTIPGSDFCAFYTSNDTVVHKFLFIGYSVVLNSLDTLILLLTCHRLVDGGLLGVPRSIKKKVMRLFNKKAVERKSTLGIIPARETISALLIRQGLHYYVILVVARLAYLVVYYLSTNGRSVYQVLCTSILATLGPLLANRLFRETSDFVRARTVIRSNNNHSDDRLPATRQLPSTMTMGSSTFKMQPVQGSNKDSSLDDDDDRDDFTFPGQNPSKGGPRNSIHGLKIYVNERMSSFIDEGDVDAPAALPRLAQHHLSYAEPPAPPSSSMSPINMRPFKNTIPVNSISNPLTGSPRRQSVAFQLPIVSPPARTQSPVQMQPSTAQMQPLAQVESPVQQTETQGIPSFDIRLKRPDSRHQEWF